MWFCLGMGSCDFICSGLDNPEEINCLGQNMAIRVGGSMWNVGEYELRVNK